MKNTSKDNLDILGTMPPESPSYKPVYILLGVLVVAGIAATFGWNKTMPHTDPNMVDKTALTTTQAPITLPGEYILEPIDNQLQGGFKKVQIIQYKTLLTPDEIVTRIKSNVSSDATVETVGDMKKITIPTSFQDVVMEVRTDADISTVAITVPYE